MSKNKYTLKLTTKAKNDLNRIYDYISKDLDAEIAAINLIEKIEMNLLRLEEFPFSCSSVGDEFLKKKGYRKMIVNNYIGFYLVDEEANEIVIMRFLYGKQKFEDIL
jgi:addiction module RelE/StbE family toxin